MQHPAGLLMFSLMLALHAYPLNCITRLCAYVSPQSSPYDRSSMASLSGAKEGFQSPLLIKGLC